MARAERQRSTGPPTSGGPFKTCEIVWWRGYVRGHFEAWTQPPSGEPRCVGESPAFVWRSSVPPPDAEPASSALETLLVGLAEEGWEVATHSSGNWYERVLWRPYDNEEEEEARAREWERRGAEPVEEDLGLVGERVPEHEHVPEPVLVRATARLIEAPEEAVQEPEWRAVPGGELDQVAESEHSLRLLPEPPVALGRRRSFAFFVVYGLAVAVAAGVFLVVFHSAYAAGVAALTATALALGVDSWFMAHRQSRVIPPGAARTRR